jgi:hypothetical protein
MDDTCWQCGGEGYLGSACIDDMCHGGDVPCCHGDEDVIACDVCGGTGSLSDTDEDDHEDAEALA